MQPLYSQQPLYPQQQPQNQLQLQPQPQPQPQQQQWVAVGGDQQPQGQAPVQNQVVHVITVTPEQQQQLQLQQKIQQLEQQLAQQQQQQQPQQQPPQQSFQQATMTSQPLPLQQQQHPQVTYQQAQLSPQDPSTLLPGPIIPGVQQVQQGQWLPQQQPGIQTIMLPQPQQQLPQQQLPAPVSPQQLPAPVSLQQISLGALPTTGSNPNSPQGSLGANGSLTLVAGGGAMLGGIGGAPPQPPVANGSLSSVGYSNSNSNSLGGRALSLGHQSGGTLPQPPPNVGVGLAGGSGSGSGTQFVQPIPQSLISSRNHLRGDFAAMAPPPMNPAQFIAAQQQELKKPATVYQPEEDLRPDPSDTGPKQLIVNYIPVEVEAKELYELFLKYGALQCVKVMMNQQTGVSRGFGFIYFVTSADAAEASSALHGFELHGKILRVGYAVPQRPLNEGRANRPPNSGK